MAVLIGLLGLAMCGLLVRWLRQSDQGLPFILPGSHWLLGHLRLIAKDGLFHYLHQQCTADRRIFTLKLGAVPMVVINDVPTARELLTRKFQHFHDRPLPPVGAPSSLEKGLILAQGATWKRQREACNPMFAVSSTSYARTFSEDVQSCLRSFVDELASEAKKAGDKIDIHHHILKLTLAVVQKTHFSVSTDGKCKSDLVEELLQTSAQLVKKNFRSSPILALSYIFPWAGRFIRWLRPPRLAQRVRQLTLAVLKERRQRIMESEPYDFLTLLQRAQLSDEDIAQQSTQFMLAGYETTATTIAAAIGFLAAHPTVQSKLHQELQRNLDLTTSEIEHESLAQYEYLDCILKETLRLVPAVAQAVRRCDRETKLPELKATLPAGVAVAFPIYTFHRDPQYWGRQADVFTPERWLNLPATARTAYLPFGAGPRECIGMRFAQDEAKLALITLCRHFQFEMLRPIEWTQGMTMVPEKGIWVRVLRR